MKNAWILTVFACSLAWAELPPQGIYLADSDLSRVEFKIKNLGIPTKGRFDVFSAEIRIGETLEECSVWGSVETASIHTGIHARDKHLRSKTFFEVDKYPAMTFKSAQIIGAVDSFQMTGDLTIKDITRPVTFDCKYVPDFSGKSPGEFSAETKIKRKDFGIDSFPTISNELKIFLTIYLDSGKSLPQ